MSADSIDCAQISRERSSSPRFHSNLISRRFRQYLEAIFKQMLSWPSRKRSVRRVFFSNIALVQRFHDFETENAGNTSLGGSQSRIEISKAEGIVCARRNRAKEPFD